MDPEKNASEVLLELLVEEGLLDAERASAVRRRRDEAWIPVGKVLRLQGCLTVAQVDELLEHQTRAPRRRFGELACERGLLTAPQVEHALRTQRDLSPHLLDFVAATPGIEPEKLLRAVVRYGRALEERYARHRGA